MTQTEREREKKVKSIWLFFTITPEDQWCWRAENCLLCDSVVNHTGVISHIRGLHFGNVQTPGLLRNKSSTVLLDRVWIFIENPCKCQL